MKVAFIISYGVFSPSNGIVSQALTWKNGLEGLGHEVVLINMWDKNDWKTFDAILFYGFSDYSCGFIKLLSAVNPNIIVAPILDPNYSVRALKAYSHWGNHKLRLTNSYYSLRQVKNCIRTILVRSEFEKKYMIEGFGFLESQCKTVRLSCGIITPNVLPLKESFCLHISLLCDERKNVKRLIEAACKYNFHLVLAGKLRTKEEEERLRAWIGNASNIEYRGFVSEEEKMDLYAKARVFALPSTNEGVGIVALEAAAMGCDIVITQLGGPHEYYAGMAKQVDPYDVDGIGQAVKSLLSGDTFQPELSKFVQDNYNIRTVSEKLAAALFA